LRKFRELEFHPEKVLFNDKAAGPIGDIVNPSMSKTNPLVANEDDE
jgi:hypothetical protein